MGQAALKSFSHRRYYLNKRPAPARFYRAAMTPASFQRRDLDMEEYRAARPTDNDRNGTWRSSVTIMILCQIYLHFYDVLIGPPRPRLSGLREWIRRAEFV